MWAPGLAVYVIVPPLPGHRKPAIPLPESEPLTVNVILPAAIFMLLRIMKWVHKKWLLRFIVFVKPDSKSKVDRDEIPYITA